MMARVLVTNDDGIDAPGLLALAAAAVAAGYDVTIAAPATQSSGSSASIMAEDEDGRIAVDRRGFDELPHVSAFAVHGGPGLIAMIAARGAFGEPADVVLSGANHGANVGRAILHSGTVGAALTAALNGARGLAVSLDVGMQPREFHWETAAEAAVGLLPQLLRLPVGTTLNVNVPNAGSHRGYMETALAPFGIVQTTLSENDAQYIRLAVEDLPNRPEPGTDAAHLADGWVTVTAVDPVAHTRLGLFDTGPELIARDGSSGDDSSGDET
ncbi:5'/3'-nucleotidase SurE [Leucobacter sp. USCH14]|uniref:5'/3'-nucleotidase SurE n=1 Tax=Leucobacter sp. USCH14 TaxID=3024838 RepID=UPI0030A29DDC